MTYLGVSKGSAWEAVRQHVRFVTGDAVQMTDAVRMVCAVPRVRMTHCVAAEATK